MKTPDQKCASCINSRPVVSENGTHPVCVLHAAKVYLCLKDGRHYKPVKKEE